MSKKLFFLMLLMVFTGPLGYAQVTVFQVEEDWQLTLGEPDPEIDAPQVTASIVPFATKPDLHLQINLNHALKPEFSSGGIQIRLMNENELVQQIHKRPGEKLSNDSEVVRWTTLVQRKPTGYIFGISTGSSTSWGAFGGNYHFLDIPASLAPGGLEGYDFQRSLDNSGVQYAGNRVQSLRLLRVRITYMDGQVAELNIHRDVD
jgi:hypothetical protein